MRTHFCGLIDEALIGQSVTLCGWADVARNMGQIVFIDLRDHEGIVQVVAEPADAAHGGASAAEGRTPEAAADGNAAMLAAAAAVGYEDCLRITGTVRRRQSVNDRLKTGRVEVVAERIEVVAQRRHQPGAGAQLALHLRMAQIQIAILQANVLAWILMVMEGQRRGFVQHLDALCHHFHPAGLEPVVH